MTKEVSQSRGFTPFETSGSGSSRTKFRTGFTLIELLLVVSILGVVVAISTPQFKKTFWDLELVQTTNKLAKLMHYARQRAVTEQVKYRIRFSDDKHSYRLLREGGSQTQGDFDNIASRIGRRQDIGKGIGLEFSKEFIDFSPDGHIDQINLCLTNLNRRKMCITTTRTTGYIRVIEDNG